MEGLIKDGHAYLDATPVDEMREMRDTGKPTKYRNLPAAEHLKIWKNEFLKGTAVGQTYCVRAKMSVDNPNKCLRDPVFFRTKVDVPHHRTGTKYKAYPTYDFCCPVVDYIEGVTHALRTLEYKDRAPMYDWVLDKIKAKRKVHVVEFSKTQFTHTVLSKRKLTWFVENGKVNGWFDPRMPTVQGIVNRGMTVEALKDFVMTQGASTNNNLMEWDKIWGMNRQRIDEQARRHAAVDAEQCFTVKLTNVSGKADAGILEPKKIPFHPKVEALGERTLFKHNEVLIEGADAKDAKVGEPIVLLQWGVVNVKKIDAKAKVVEGELDIEADPRKIKMKFHWIPKDTKRMTKLTLRELDHLVTKPKMEEEDAIEDIINPKSQLDTPGWGDCLIKDLKVGAVVQLERRGFYKLHAIDAKLGHVFIWVPDGKAKVMSNITGKVDVANLRGGGAGAKKQKKGEKPAAAAAPAAGGAEPEPLQPGGLGGPKIDVTKAVRYGMRALRHVKFLW